MKKRDGISQVRVWTESTVILFCFIVRPTGNGLRSYRGIRVDVSTSASCRPHLKSEFWIDNGLPSDSVLLLRACLITATVT